LGSYLPGWVWMWTLALALFFGAKWITLCPLLQWSGRRINQRRLIAYCLLWPGMDARAFCSESVVPIPRRSEGIFVSAKIFLGASLVAASVLAMDASQSLLTGWIGMIG